MAVRIVLLEGRLTFKTYLEKGEGGLKSYDFRGVIIYGWSLRQHFLFKTSCV